MWGSFHFDDYSLFSGSLFHPFGIRPLTYLTFWLNNQFGGREPAGYHAINLLLHLAAVLLLWRALRRLVSARAAWIASAIFAVHPVEAEAVNYVFARSTLLATVLCLAALVCWTRQRYWWAVPWFAAALLAKEECVAFPAVLLLIQFGAPRQLNMSRDLQWKPIVVMFGVSLAAGVRVLLATAVTSGSGAGLNSEVSWQSYALAQGTVILRYLRMLILPWGFTVDPAVAVPPVWLGALAWATVLALAAAALFQFTGARAGFWFIAGLVLLLPSSSILPATDLAADRRMYLPMIGFATCVALLLERTRPQLVGVALVLLAGLSVQRTAIWRTEEALWSDAANRAPDKIRPKIQLARAVDPGRALAMLDDARRSAPEDPRIPAEVGRILLTQGKTLEALRAFGRALALDPRNPEAFNNRGAALLALNQKEAARQDFERALAIDPCEWSARLNLRRLGVVEAPPSRCEFNAQERAALGLN